MGNKKYIDVSQAMDRATVFDWYISSVDDTQSPIWTDEHIEELMNDFYLVHKDIPLVEAKPLRHGKWEFQTGNVSCSKYICSYCNDCKITATSDSELNEYRYCPNCGAKMDKE